MFCFKENRRKTRHFGVSSIPPQKNNNNAHTHTHNSIPKPCKGNRHQNTKILGAPNLCQRVGLQNILQERSSFRVFWGATNPFDYGNPNTLPPPPQTLIPTPPPPPKKRKLNQEDQTKNKTKKRAHTHTHTPKKKQSTHTHTKNIYGNPRGHHRGFVPRGGAAPERRGEADGHHR